jgi:hypothetical protein
METKTSRISENFVWGEPDSTPNNTGKLKAMCIWVLALVCCNVAYFYSVETMLSVRPPSRPGEEGFNGPLLWTATEICFATVLGYLAFSSHFRLDGILANAEGMRVSYSYIQKIGRDYVNERIFVTWSDVISVDKVDDGEGSFRVSIVLKNALLDGTTTLSLMNCSDEEEAELVRVKLRDLRG